MNVLIVGNITKDVYLRLDERRNKFELDEDKTREMYDLITKTLKNNGYIHYEISNFSKKGFYSKHNLCYWNNENYYGNF